MPQLLHPSFLRLGRRTAALVLLLLGAAVLLVTGLARPADATRSRTWPAATPPGRRG